jgi:hypothetical protein
MSRKLQLLFRRDPSRDRQEGKIDFQGYEVLWPDGRPVALGLEALCTHGQRLLSLGRHLAGCSERLIDLVCFHLSGPEDDITRLPGHRVRRFYVERHGRHGRLHFFDGTPTAIVVDMSRDEPHVLQWIGLMGLRDGERQWFDLAAQPTSSLPQDAALQGHP